MNEGYIIAGLLLLTAGMIDFLWTTLWLESGAGPITRCLSAWLWKGCRKISGDHAKILSMAGPLLLCLTLVIWISLFWSGWVLIYSSDPHSLMETQSKEPASWSDRIYFSGYVMFTLGNGDLAPNGGLWKLVTIIETAQGLLTITFSVTYLISVLSAVNQKRSFAQSVLSLGHDGTEIVHNAWNGKDFHDIDFLLVAASSELGKLTAQHNAFPILHFYHSTQHQESSIIAVAVLDEALTIFKYGIPEQYQPNQLHIKEARSSIKNYLDTVHTAYIHPAEQAPPEPDISKLQQSGIPALSKQTFQIAVNSIKERRQLLLGIIQAGARKWPVQEQAIGNAYSPK
ncbi:potassium channel family protein [Bacillus subtilis]|uniref:potassium channel family protein n=1 Tax=Bacillus TaxID=1386 RepID=UPI0030D31DD4